MISRVTVAMCTGILIDVPAVAYACSGPGAPEAIAANERRGTALFVLALCCFLAAIVVRYLRSQRLFPFLLWGPVLVPFRLLFMGGSAGDCGMTSVAMNLLLARACVVALVMQVRAATGRAA